MPSLLPGFEYDIFISYRHKDNKYDSWVTTFVDDLRKELEATFKGDISIYFDENPHDGLHANHDVDDSLREKIKVLVFIPIVSMTYCDPNSFAWSKEFIAFRDFALQDELGLKIKVANANVTSRILPVRIHDLDAADVKLFETTSGSILRPIDFIFKSAGVNRPLAHHDQRADNQNHTLYRDQINKVAMAVREIINGLQEPRGRSAHVAATSTTPSQTKAFSPRRLLVPVLILLLLLSVGYGVSNYLKSNRTLSVDSSEGQIDRSIAVLPFTNMSADKEQDYFCDGLSEELLNVLAKVPDLKVISRTSAFSFKGKNEDVRSIAEKLGVAYVLEGSIRKSSDKVRITAQLIKASDGTHLWSETFDRDMSNIFKVQDEISNAVVKELKVKLLGSGIAQARASKPEVYNLWLQSRYNTGLSSQRNSQVAYGLIKKALEIDSLDARAWAQLGAVHIQLSNEVNTVVENERHRANGLRAAEKAIALDPNLADGYQIKGVYENFQGDMEAAEKSFRKAVVLEPKNASTLSKLGADLTNMGRMEEAKALLQKAIELDPVVAGPYANLGICLLYEGRFNEARANFEKALLYAPFSNAQQGLVNVSLATGDQKRALVEASKVRNDFWRSYCLIMCLSSNNRKQEAQDSLAVFEKRYREVGPFQVAEIYSWMGEDDKAFEWIDLAFKYRDPGLTEIKNSIFFQPRVNDPRYVAVLKKMKLPI